jgi:hypothetical protein
VGGGFVVAERPTARSGRGQAWERLIRAAILNGADLKNGLTLKGLLERTGTDQFPTSLEYKDAVKSALQSMRSDELRYVESNRPGGHGLSLGPGLGLVIGASLGSRSCRAALLHPHGWLAEDEKRVPYFEVESALDGQLGMPSADLLRRLAAPITRLMNRAASDSNLLVEGRLPLLGIAVGWPTPLRHDKRPAGSGLSHPDWGATTVGVDAQLAELLGIDPALSNAINATNAAGLWAAWKLTSSADRETTARRAEVIMCLRLSAAIGASSVIVPVPEGALRPPFLDSNLIEGKTGVAGTSHTSTCLPP